MTQRKIWLPLVTWIVSVILVAYLLYSFYTPSPTITVTYIAIVLAGFYIVWKGREISEAGKKIKRKIKIKAAAKLKKKARQ
jgi:amino acid transporter